MKKIVFTITSTLPSDEKQDLIDFVKGYSGVLFVKPISSSSKIKSVANTCYAALDPNITDDDLNDVYQGLCHTSEISSIFIQNE